jgi:hypothetical protein
MEYRVETLGGAMRGPKPEDLEGLLNQASEEGWVLSEMGYKPNSNQLWVVLQRESPEGPRRRSRRSWLADWS